MDVAALDLLALGEGRLLQEALAARHQIASIARLDAPDEVAGLRAALEGRCGQRPRRRGGRSGRLGGGRGAFAAAKRCGENEDSAKTSQAGRTSHRRISPSEFAKAAGAWRPQPTPKSHGRQNRVNGPRFNKSRWRRRVVSASSAGPHPNGRGESVTASARGR